jgi:hypothetical protein
LLSLCANLPPGLLTNGESSYDVIMSGKVCKKSEHTQLLSCEYWVGNDLHFTIDAIGTPGGGFTVMKSSFDGDYYIT